MKKRRFPFEDRYEPKAYLHESLEYEQNPKVRKLVKKDIEFLDNVQVEMATARQFLFTARIKDSKDKQVFDTANRVEKIISEQGFEVRRMRKADIKRFPALYFEASMDTLKELQSDIAMELTRSNEVMSEYVGVM